MPKREVLEDLEVLEPRVSPLGDIEALLEEDEGDVEMLGGENGRPESDTEEGSENGRARSPEEELERERTSAESDRQESTRREDQGSGKGD